MEGEFGGEWVHAYVWRVLSLCARNITTLLIGYNPIQKKKNFKKDHFPGIGWIQDLYSCFSNYKVLTLSIYYITQEMQHSYCNNPCVYIVYKASCYRNRSL